MPMPLTIGTSRALLGQADAAAAWLALLQSSATYAWDGVQGLSLAAWVDVVAGVSAATVGSGTNFGTLNGRNAAVFSTSGRYATTAFAAGDITQPYAIVSVAQSNSTGRNQFIHDGIETTKRAAVFWELPSSQYVIFSGAAAGSTVNTRAPVVIVATFNGASSSLTINGVASATLNAGTHALSGITIGASFNTSLNAIDGPIAHVSIYHGARLANAATVAAAARAYYGI